MLFYSCTSCINIFLMILHSIFVYQLILHVFPSFSIPYTPIFRHFYVLHSFCIFDIIFMKVNCEVTVLNTNNTDTRQIIKDLMKWNGFSQRKLAEESGIDFSHLNRFLGGSIDSLSYKEVAALARTFRVSSDFILGLTDDIYFGQDLRSYAKADPTVMSQLLKNKSFVMTTRLIRQYLDEGFAVGVAIQNQILDSVAVFIGNQYPGNKALMESLPLMKRPPSLIDEEMITRYFMNAVREIKRNNSSMIESAKTQAKAVSEKYLAELNERKKAGESIDASFGVLIEKLMLLYHGLLGEINGREDGNREMDQAV